MRRWRDATQTFPELREQDAVSLPVGEERVDGAGIGSAGSHLGRYVILYRLGSGGMGVVFAAYDPELDRKVALKLVRLENSSPAAREALRREAQAMARLSHPNIVAVHDVGGEGHDVFLAMDLIDGVTLDEWLALDKRGWRDILRVFVQAGRGLAAAHAAGVVHHDFSPRNVLVTAEEKALITDFGLARALGGPDAGPPDEPREETVRGTPAYLAPERLLGVAVDPRSDQFSFCAALYRALCATAPFPADSPEHYLERVGQGALAPPQDGRRVPRRLLPLLRRGLDARPENRFATMPELLEKLEAALRRPRVLLFAAVTLPLAAAAAIVLLGRPDQAPTDRLAGVWSPAQRQSVRKALVRHDPAVGAQAASRLESEIDEYAARWRAIDEDGYRSHRAALRGGSGLVRDRQRLCLDARRAELRALISRLEAWQDRSLEPAVRAVQGLSDLGSCADVRVLRDLKAPPPDARTRRAMVPLQNRLEEQFTLLETGVPDLALVDLLVTEADRLGYLPLVLRAREIRASIRRERGVPGTQADLQAALRAAVASADPIGQARMFGLLAEDIGLKEGRFEDARLWRDLAESGLAALGPGHEEVKIRVLRSLGAAALAEGNNREAARRYRRSIALIEQLWGKETTRLTVILNNLAIAVSSEEDEGAQEAMALLRRALAIGERAYGPDSPIVINPLSNLASELAAAGSYREALGLTQRVIRIQERYYGTRFRDLGYPLIISGQILIALDEPADALAALDRSMVVVREGYGEEHHLVIQAWCARADAELAQLHAEAAAESVARCRAGLEGALPPGHPVFITLRRLEGEVELARGRTARARSILAEAAGMPGAETLETVQIMAPLAEAELASRDPAAARRAGEAGLALGNPVSDPALVGRLRFALARALMRTDPHRAIGLARQAVKDLSQGSPRTRSLRASATAWLDATRRKHGML